MPLQILSILILLLFVIPIQVGAVTPSQVLVLYNADWREDHPLSAPGQDSREIAEHYVHMHTDHATGEKPYLLGLRCEHGIKVLDEARHLNAKHLEEHSSDNAAGVVFKRTYLFGPSPKDDQLRDSRLIEFALPGGSSAWNMATLHMDLKPDKGEELPLVRDGLVQVKGKISVGSSDKWTIRLDGKSFANGALTLTASCADRAGKVHSWHADYVDVDDVELSCSGRDGKRDDLHFIEDVAQPLKNFLEDPENARPDGTLLKDHILLMVVCYGLPRTAVAPCGIARGITEQAGNYGAIIDFGQRLQLLYYDIDKVMGKQLRGYLFSSKSPFRDYLFRAPQNRPLVDRANPFLHSQLYASSASLSEGPQPLSFTVANRTQHPERFLYFVSRIDAPEPLQAKALIDRAVYASAYAGPEMGMLPEQDYPQDKKRTGYLSRSKAGLDLWERGYRHLYYGGQGKNLLEWGRLAPEDGFLNEDISYLPGGIAATVISHNGWKKGEMVRDLRNGVTATAGAAKVYRGAPHIHNKSWWDDDVFYSALLRGNTLGEAWLMNQMNLGWITTFVGDPLMQLPATPAVPQPLHIDVDTDVSFKVAKNAHGVKEVWLQVDLHSTAAHPQVAQLMAVSQGGAKVVSSTFDARPSICLGEKGTIPREWALTLMSPFGHKATTNIEVEI